MKVVVTHMSPDMDAITSVWLIKRFLPGWEEAAVRFVPAGDRLNPEFKIEDSEESDPIELIGEDEFIHVDTGMGPLDHHQTSDLNVCGASRTFDYVKRMANGKWLASRSGQMANLNEEKWKYKEEAVSRMVRIVVDVDHFQELFWENPTADRHEFTVMGVLEGLKSQKPDQDVFYVEFISQCLDALLHDFENRIFAEKEIQKGIEFEAKWGKGLGMETINDMAIKLAQKMGYTIVVRKDPRKGYVRIKAKPIPRIQSSELKIQNEDIDLTLVREKLQKMDPDATWFLHVSKKMLLNGTPKNPKMRPTRLSLKEIIKVIGSI